MSWYGPLLCCCYTFFTSHDYVYVADIECQVMFSLVTLYCSMLNIALVTWIFLVTFLGLQYWSASMINIYKHRKMCIFCLEPREMDKSVLKFSKNLVLKFHFLVLGALWMSCYCHIHNTLLTAEQKLVGNDGKFSPPSKLFVSERIWRRTQGFEKQVVLLGASTFTVSLSDNSSGIGHFSHRILSIGAWVNHILTSCYAWYTSGC